MISDCLICTNQYNITMFSTLNGIHSVTCQLGSKTGKMDLRVVGQSPDMYLPQAVWILFSNAVNRLLTSLSRSTAQTARFTRSASLRNCDNLGVEGNLLCSADCANLENETAD